jgi:hypothetical protein
MHGPSGAAFAHSSTDAPGPGPQRDTAPPPAASAVVTDHVRVYNVVWDGALDNGAKAAPGVYFYRVDGIQFEGGSAPQKMILLSGN